MDERVTSAISHWGPRFTTNGVTVADFERVTSSVEKWSQWCAAWSAAGAEHEALGRTALADGRLRSAGEHLSMAAVYFHFGKFLFVEEYDEMREAHGRPCAASTTRCRTWTRPVSGSRSPSRGPGWWGCSGRLLAATVRSRRC